MPWKECNIVEERLRFIARLLDGEKMAVATRLVSAVLSMAYRRGEHSVWEHYGEKNPLRVHLPGAIPHLL